MNSELNVICEGREGEGICVKDCRRILSNLSFQVWQNS